MSGASRMQDLFAAAREDAPSEDVHDQVWGRVVAATAAPAAAAAVKAAVVPSGGKLLAVGALIGAVTTGVVALVAFDAGGARTPAPSARAPAIIATGSVAGARLSEPALRGRAELAPEATPASTPSAANAPEATAASAPSVAITPIGKVVGNDPAAKEPSARGAAKEPSATVAGVVTNRARAPRDDTSALAEEARLVTEARAALVRGEPDLALALTRSTRRLAARALEPEELALEARALRALGRTDEALATELTLRRRFPSHALSR
ncbi:MAG: hypothetical protein KF894_14345 [Labilithrix sp.]|nr:hypothetical protein [Labilithrix sp.]